MILLIDSRIAVVYLLLCALKIIDCVLWFGQIVTLPLTPLSENLKFNVKVDEDYFRYQIMYQFHNSEFECI